jgi:hypothetical protein
VTIADWRHDNTPDKCLHEASAERRGLSVEKQREMRCRTGDPDETICGFCRQKMSEAADQAAEDLYG